MRKTFVVGRLTGRTAEIRLLEDDDAAPEALEGATRGARVDGSRLLQALVRSLSPSSPPPLPLSCPGTIH